MSPRSTNASRAEAGESRQSVDFYKSESSFKHINMAGNQTYQRQPSLAQSLKQRREFQEQIQKERQQFGTADAKKVKDNARQKYTVKETDLSGSAIRIRPQRQERPNNFGRPETPKLNLLQLQQRR